LISTFCRFVSIQVLPGEHLLDAYRGNLELEYIDSIGVSLSCNRLLLFDFHSGRDLADRAKCYLYLFFVKVCGMWCCRLGRGGFLGFYIRMNWKPLFTHFACRCHFCYCGHVLLLFSQATSLFHCIVIHLSSYHLLVTAFKSLSSEVP